MEGASPAGRFNEHAHTDNTYADPWVFCRHVFCRECPSDPESATLHSDCLAVFRATSGALGADDGLAALWTAATWRSPWHRAPVLHLNPSVNVSAVLGHAAAAWDLP